MGVRYEKLLRVLAAAKAALSDKPNIVADNYDEYPTEELLRNAGA